METELNTEHIGETLGLEGVSSIVSKAEKYCTHEARRIVLKNEPAICSLQGRIAILNKVRSGLELRIAQAHPSSDVRSHRRQAMFYAVVAVLLVVSAFVFSVLTFAPFHFGWKSYLYALGVASVTAILLHAAIEYWNSVRFIKTIVTAGVVAALASLVLLAVIRGDLLARQTEVQSDIVVSDDIDTMPRSQPENNFYNQTIPLLQLAMALLAFAMEVGAGFALHKTKQLLDETGEDVRSLCLKLEAVLGEIVACAAGIKELENEAQVFVNRFWRNFYRAMLSHTVRNAMTKLMLGAIFLSFALFSHHAEAEDRVAIVAALDLTQSVAGGGPDRQTSFQKNVHAIEKLLSQIPPASHVVILGITDRSFTQPYILLSARVPDDPGYFGERLAGAHRQLVALWKRRSADLRPQFRSTDILGVFLLASQIFDEEPSQATRVLIFLSDMRQSSNPFNLESQSLVPRFNASRKQLGPESMARLSRTSVYALGVEGGGKSLAYWQSLKDFWTGYVESCGGTVNGYSVLRESPAVLKKEP